MVPSVERFVHAVDDLASKALVSAGPDEDRRMVLIPLVHGFCTVKQESQIFHLVSRNGLLERKDFLHDCIKYAVGFHICLINHVQTVPVAQAVESCSIRIMARADRIDVIPLHENDILLGKLIRDTSSADR